MQVQNEDLAALLGLKKASATRQSPRHFVLSVSGGSDSMALLAIFLKLRESFRLRLSVIHFNFHLRGKDSLKDEKLVKAFAKKNKISVLIVDRPIRSKKGIQQQARRARIEASRVLLTGAEWVEAHQADDQAETFLFRLFRGAGPEGLEGIQSKSIREGRLIWRPLLLYSKKELQDYCSKHGIPWRQDQSNLASNYSRNQIRNEILPVIHSRFQSAKANLLMTQRLIRDESLYLEEETEKLWSNEVSERGLWLKEFREKPRVLRLRLLRRFLQSQTGRVPHADRLFELDQKLMHEDRVIWNAPGNFQLRVSLKRAFQLRPLPAANNRKN